MRNSGNERVIWPDDFESNEHLGDEINRKIKESERAGGAWVEMLRTGDRLKITTKRNTYLLEKREDGIYLSGNPKYCPAPVNVRINGSRFDRNSKMLKMKFIGLGMYMEYVLLSSGKTVVSSEVTALNWDR